MPRYAALFLTTVLIAAMLSSCGATDIGGTHPIEDSRDVIIPPDSSSDSGLNSNQRNVGNANNLYQQNIVNRLYDQIGGDEKLADFDADESSIYTLESKGQSDGVDFGDTVRVYGLEDSRTVNEITFERMTECTSIAVLDGRLYAYDIAAGSIYVFSVDGQFINEISTGMPDLNVEKMMDDSGDRLIIKYAGDTLEEGGILVLDMNQETSYNIDRNALIEKLDYPEEQVETSDVYIQDFCIYDDRTIFIKVFPERLCLFNMDDRTIEKISYMPDSARFIEYDSGILYYASGLKIGIFSNNLANLSNEGSQDVMGRLLINDKFCWSVDPLSLAVFQLGEIIIPFHEQNYQHVKMRQNNKYVFLLDNETSSQEGKSSGGNHIIRIAK